MDVVKTMLYGKIALGVGVAGVIGFALWKLMQWWKTNNPFAKISNIGSNIKNKISSIGSNIKDNVSSFGKKVADTAKSVTAKVKEEATEFGGKVQNVVESKTFQAVYDSTPLGTVANTIRNVTQGQDVKSAVSNALKESPLATAMGKTVVNTAKTIQTSVQTVVPKINAGFTNAVQAVKNVIPAKPIEAAKPVISNIVKTVSTPIKAIFTPAPAPKPLVSNILKTVTSPIKSLTATASKIKLPWGR